MSHRWVASSVCLRRLVVSLLQMPSDGERSNKRSVVSPSSRPTQRLRLSIWLSNAKLTFTHPFNLNVCPVVRSVTCVSCCQARLGVTECASHELLSSYPVMFASRGSVVAHFRCTVLLLPSGTSKVSFAPPANQRSARSSSTDVRTHAAPSRCSIGMFFLLRMGVSPRRIPFFLSSDSIDREAEPERLSVCDSLPTRSNSCRCTVFFLRQTRFIPFF